MTNNIVRTRFAPSPTGLLHIGGARTALFNWLFAKHTGGEYLLRIEDTDQTRNTPENVQAILDSLKWLGIDHDKEPVLQSVRMQRHQAVVAQMVENGSAYRCYCTADELTQMRQKAEREKRAFLYSGVWRDRKPEDYPDGQPYVIRLRAPQTGSTIIKDRIQGKVEVKNQTLDDMILLRSDGTPVYMLAVVVDDHDMGITHVMRGDDHLSNTFRQALVYDAMNWTRPEFAHLPLINGPDGKKYSKRHGAVGVMEFAEQGYLPEAVNQYLLSLGWWTENIDTITIDQAAKLFDLTHMNRAAARMDFKKLTHINAACMKKVAPEVILQDLSKRLTNVLQTKNPDQDHAQTVHFAVESAKLILPEMIERARTLKEFADNALFLLGVNWTDKGNSVVLDNSNVLEKILTELKTCQWDKESLHNCVLGFAEKEQLPIAAVAQPLRAALTGGTTSPPIDATLFALGAKESLNRVEQAIEMSMVKGYAR